MKLSGTQQRLIALGVWGSKVGLNPNVSITPSETTENEFTLQCEQGNFTFTHKALYERFNDLVDAGFKLDAVCAWVCDVDIDSHADVRLSVYLRLNTYA